MYRCRSHHVTVSVRFQRNRVHGSSLGSRSRSQRHALHPRSRNGTGNRRLPRKRYDSASNAATWKELDALASDDSTRLRCRLPRRLRLQPDNGSAWIALVQSRPDRPNTLKPLRHSERQPAFSDKRPCMAGLARVAANGQLAEALPATGERSVSIRIRARRGPTSD